MSLEPTDADRYPTLTEEGRRMLNFMGEHPAAPIFRNQSGNRLTFEEVEKLRKSEMQLRNAAINWVPGVIPDWVPPFVSQAYASVPFYRNLGSLPLNFEDISPVSRADLARDIAPFVPDHVSIDGMINFRTTGTTGHPLLIASHPIVAASYLSYHKRAMDRFGIQLAHSKGQVGVILLGFQKKCFTYLSVTPTMEESGLAKINLHEDDWREPDDRGRYLDAMAPEVIAGDPISFAELLNLGMQHKPRVMMSVSMMLLPGLRSRLESTFGCPVLDIYSLNEVGPVGVYDARAGGHVLLQPQLYVEILDAEGKNVRQGERGEITVTGGFNFCLPLLRYRTGDYASLSFGVDGPMLVDLSGRSPVRYKCQNDTWINNIDITHALHSLAIPHFRFHQMSNGDLELHLSPSAMHLADPARICLQTLFGSQSVIVQPLTAEDKTIQYTSNLPGAQG